MKSNILFAAVFAALSAYGQAAIAQSDDTGIVFSESEYQPRWTASAGTIILHRSNARPALLAENGTTNEELANTRDFELGWAAGPDLQLTRHSDSGWDVNLRYFMVDGWNAGRDLRDPGNIRVPLVSSNPEDFFDTASAYYASRLYSTEINLQRQVNERLRILAGFRWVELHERISADAWSPSLEGLFRFGTANRLYGFQLGAEGRVFERGPFAVDGFLKAGIYSNQIGANIYGEGTYFGVDDSANTSRASFLGEIGLTARYNFNRHWSVYGGYEVMWIEGVALAGDAVAALASPDENAFKNGTAFYHGAVTGLELHW